MFVSKGRTNETAAMQNKETLDICQSFGWDCPIIGQTHPKHWFNKYIFQWRGKNWHVCKPEPDGLWGI